MRKVSNPAERFKSVLDSKFPKIIFLHDKRCVRFPRHVLCLFVAAPLFYFCHFEGIQSRESSKIVKAPWKCRLFLLFIHGMLTSLHIADVIKDRTQTPQKRLSYDMGQILEGPVGIATLRGVFYAFGVVADGRYFSVLSSSAAAIFCASISTYGSISIPRG